ncbi:transposase [Roseateles sp. GG27B]
MATHRAVNASCKGRPGGAYRAFFDALLWMPRTGSPWRDLPERLGAWNVVHQRYAYWCKKAILSAFSRVCSSPTWRK